MSPVLQTLITNAASIQRQNLDPTRRMLAWLLTAYGAGALGQSPVLGSASTQTASIAQATAAKFQGFTPENFLDVLTYTVAQKLNTNGVSGIVAAGVVPTDGFALNSLVNTSWGGPNGVVDADVVNNLLWYGALIQAGANLTNI